MYGLTVHLTSLKNTETWTDLPYPRKMVLRKPEWKDVKTDTIIQQPIVSLTYIRNSLCSQNFIELTSAIQLRSDDKVS